VKDCTGILQCVGSTDILRAFRLREEDAIEIHGSIRREMRAQGGFELDILAVAVLNPAMEMPPFHSASDLSSVSPEILLDHRPLALRNERIGDIFRIQGAILRYFREFLIAHQFTEIISSKIVGGGTEGGTNLFAIRYFDRVAYLAQSPQFYKEHGVAGFERVFETGHVYRAEPHATSRHLTEYYSLDLEIGFIDGPEDVIQLERELLSFIFAKLNDENASLLARFRSNPLPSMLQVPIWDFNECVRRLRAQFGRTELRDDLDPAAERQLCSMAEQEFGVPAVLNYFHEESPDGLRHGGPVAGVAEPVFRFEYSKSPDGTASG
jgi:nondiscriminating aspartyl-tRNA synthetase